MIKKLFLLSVVAVLCACNKQENNEPELLHSSIKIYPTITRATNISFQESDEIGLSIAYSDSEFNSENNKLSYVKGLFTGNVTWSNKAEGTANLTAYYPYSADGLPQTFTVATDQTGDALTQSDLMLATANNITPSERSVPMTFEHKLSKLIINVVNEGDLLIESVKIMGVKISAEYDKTNNRYLATGVSSDIVAHQVDETTYSIIIPSQELACRVVARVEGDKEYITELSSASFEVGKQYSTTITIIKDAIEEGGITAGDWTIATDENKFE